MLILISPAKTFAKKPLELKGLGQKSLPQFASEAEALAHTMAQYSTEQLSKLLKLTPKMASDAHRVWQDFALGHGSEYPAFASYSGIVFKYLKPAERSTHALAHAERYVRICSFCYGLLRPTDVIRPYRLEGACKLEIKDKVQSVFEYWRSLLTKHLIAECKSVAEGKLLFLASEEMKQLFHWSEVEAELEVYTPYFYNQTTKGLKQATVYTKMARGTILAEIIEAQITDPEALTALQPLGFSYSAEHSDSRNLYFL